MLTVSERVAVSALVGRAGYLLLGLGSLCHVALVMEAHGPGRFDSIALFLNQVGCA